MKKIGIMSFPRYQNYGTYLQLYALQSTVAALGYKPEIIDYDPYNDSGNRSRHPMGNALRKTLRPLLRALKKAVFPDKIHSPQTVYTVSNNNAFDKFRDNQLQLGATTYFNQYELNDNPPRCAAFITGSDQVWNPRAHFMDSAYFLAFAEPHQRIAYAPSFGVDQIPQESRGWMRQQIRGIASLSVREQNAVAMVRELSGREARLVVDPVMLLPVAEWTAFSYKRVAASRPYLFCYFLESDPYMRERALTLAEQLGLDLYLLPVNALDRDIRDERITLLHDIGPREFVGLIRHAELVCTDSFHGSVFSIMLKRPFLTFQRYANPDQVAAHSRIESILNISGLGARLVSKNGTLPSAPLQVDFGPSHDKLGKLREKSIRYLAESLHQATCDEASAPLDFDHTTLWESTVV